MCISCRCLECQVLFMSEDDFRMACTSKQLTCQTILRVLPTCSLKVTRYAGILILFFTSSYYLFLCLSISFFRSIFLLISSLQLPVSKNLPSFFCHALFLSFLSSFVFLFAYFIPFFCPFYFYELPSFHGVIVLFLHQNRPFRLCCPPRFWFYGLFSERKAARHEITHKPQSSASGMNDRSCTSILPICLHDVDRDNFALFTFYNTHQNNASHISARCQQPSYSVSNRNDWQNGQHVASYLSCQV